MDEDYLLACARYVGLNPVRAGLTARAVDWPWSSVRAQLGGAPDRLLRPAPLAERLAGRAQAFFDLDVEAEARDRLRRASLTGRPLGAAAWIQALEASTGRRLVDPLRGRPPRSEAPPAAPASLFG
jgi:putative transposase